MKRRKQAVQPQVIWHEEAKTLTLEGEPVLEYTLSWPELEGGGWGGRPCRVRWGDVWQVAEGSPCPPQCCSDLEVALNGYLLILYTSVRIRVPSLQLNCGYKAN